MKLDTSRTGLEIAVIGMAGAFPGARDIDSFWKNLVSGVNGIGYFSKEELRAYGVDEALLDKENFVSAKGVFPNIEFFDSEFFDYTPSDANAMDPQARALHQCIYHALEDSGCFGEQQRNTIGLFVGASGNFSWELNTFMQRDESSTAHFAGVQLADKDFIATRIAYKLDLHGPVVTLHSACSTSLFSVDMACRQLLTGACSVAVAAGSSWNMPHKNGYLHEQGMILAKDGLCKPFSDDADGTLEGNGMGAVVLKPLEDAIEAGDNIYAIIRGFAANNDGSRKIGYTAPSVEGQADVISRAIDMAEIDSNTITYVEAHGTATSLGDPVEVEGLKKAFATEKTQYCALGSLKSNIGHLDTAAGIASFIKMVLSLKENTIPKSINFNQNNPQINFESSPFFVAHETTKWERQHSEDGTFLPLRGGVSSFGIGGTNVHIVLEEAPIVATDNKISGKHNVLCLSAKNSQSLAHIEENLSLHLKNNPELNLDDLAYTYNATRKKLPVRSTITYQSLTELIEKLSASAETQNYKTLDGKHAKQLSCIFLFPGQGTQYPGMGAELYKSEPAFKAAMDECLVQFEKMGISELESLLLNTAPTAEEISLVQQTNYAQPAIFSVEYALSRVLISFGIKPVAMLGHSLGEYVAACISGVISLPDALRLIVTRGQLMNSMERGCMLAVNCEFQELESQLPEVLDIAAVNGPTQCTVAGFEPEVLLFKETLEKQGIQCKLLKTSHAFHSAMMEPMLEAYREVLSQVEFNSPEIPYQSNLTGEWIDKDSSQSPEYYLKHIRQPVLFSQSVQSLLAMDDTVFIEVGPGNTLTNFVRQHTHKKIPAVSLLRHAKQTLSDKECFAAAIGSLWQNNVSPDWQVFYTDYPRQKIRVPLYPFKETPHTLGYGDLYTLLGQIDPKASVTLGQNSQSHSQTNKNKPCIQIDGWQLASQPVFNDYLSVSPCLIFSERQALQKDIRIVNGLRIDSVKKARHFKSMGVGRYGIDFDSTFQYFELLNYLKTADGIPKKIIVMVEETWGIARFTSRLLILSSALIQVAPDSKFDITLFCYTKPSDNDNFIHPTNASALAMRIRALRAHNPLISFRLVFVDSDMVQPTVVTRMTQEIYDTDRSTIVAHQTKTGRETFDLRDIPGSHHASSSPLAKKTLGLVFPEDKPIDEITSALSNASGAKVIPLSYSTSLPSKKSMPVLFGPDRFKQFSSSYHDNQFSDLGIVDFTDSYRLLEEACGVLVAHYINDEFELYKGRIFNRSALAMALGITDRLNKYVDYFINILYEDGVLDGPSDAIEVKKCVADLRPVNLIREELQAINDRFTGTLNIVEHCVQRYGQALKEQISPISVIYPNGKNEMLLQAYKGSFQELEEQALRVVFEAFIKQVIQQSNGRTIRILEAGGGFGMSMRRLAMMMKQAGASANVEYYFTDISQSFLMDAKQFALEEKIDFLYFGEFDITRPPAEQGLELAGFDFVFAFNVVHATSDIKRSLGHMHELIKPGGMLCVLERTVIRRFADLIWGLADGWWHFSDEERELSPLIDMSLWRTLFQDVGLDNVVSFPESSSQRGLLEMGMIMGYKKYSENVILSHDSPMLSVQATEHFSDKENGNQLDVIIILEPSIEQKQSKFLCMGDKLTVPQTQIDMLLNRVESLLRRLSVSSVYLWSTGEAYVNSADQLARTRAIESLITRISGGATRFGHYYLPEQISPSVIEQVLIAQMGELATAVIDGYKLPLFNPQKLIAADPQDGDVTSRGATSKRVAASDDRYLAILKNLWTNLFGIEQIGDDDDFFELGGDSLKVAQLTSELANHGIKVLSNEVFSNPTIRQLANYLEKNHSTIISNIENKDDLILALEEKFGWAACYHTESVDGKDIRILHVAREVKEKSTSIDEALSTLNLSTAMEPHYIVEKDLFDGDLDVSFTDWRGAKLQDESNVELIDNIKRKMDQSKRALNAAICSKTIVSNFPLSPFQKIFLKEENRFTFYMIDFDEPIQMETLKYALTDIINSQGLLRSRLQNTVPMLGRRRWREHAPIDGRLDLQEVDLSTYTPKAQSEIVEQIMTYEATTDFEALGGVMFSMLMIRYDRCRASLLFNLDHSIFDNMSGQILRKQIINRYKSLKQGNQSAIEHVKSYRHYLDQLNRGPQGITMSGLIDAFELNAFEKAKREVETYIVKNRTGRVTKSRFELDLAKHGLSTEDEATWEFTLVLVNHFLAAYLERKDIPLRVLYQGRQYQDISYYETLGLFVDVLPLLINVDDKEPTRMIADVDRKMRSVNRYNVSFMNLVLNLSMRFKWWGMLSKLMPNKLSKTDPMILLNFVGRAESEYQKIVDFSAKQIEQSSDSLGYASLYIIVMVANDKIIFDVFSSFENKYFSVEEIFSQQADRLFPESAVDEVQEHDNESHAEDNHEPQML